MSNFIVADRKTDYLLPPSVDDWLNEDHLARYIVEVVDQLDLSRLTRQYAGRGPKAHHPATLLSILIYGYCAGVFSSRKLERATYDSVAFATLPLVPTRITTRWPRSGAGFSANSPNCSFRCLNWPGK